MQSQASKSEAAKALGVILRGIELFGKDQSFLPCQRLFLNSLLWRDSVHFLQERGCVIIENRKGTFVAPKYKTLDGLRQHLEAQYGLITNGVALPDIRPNYPLRVPHSGSTTEERSNAPRRAISPHVVELLQKALGSLENPTLEQISRIARNLNISEAQVYNFVNRNRPKKRRYSTSDITRPGNRNGFPQNAFGSSSNNSDDGSDGVVRSDGVSEGEDYDMIRAPREDTKREIESMLSAVYQHGHDELYAPVEQNCVSILAKLRDTSDEDVEMNERPAGKRNRVAKRELDALDRSRGKDLRFDGEEVRTMHVAAERRGHEGMPDWWVDQSTRQQQLAHQQQIAQLAHSQHAHAQHFSPARYEHPQMHMLNANTMPHAMSMSMVGPQSQISPFPHPFALSAHALPQFAAVFPPPSRQASKEMFV